MVEATITRLTAFGAFAKIDEDIEGLIHISEMADYRISHPKEIVHEGDVVPVRVIRIDPSRRRVGLSLRQATDEAYVEVDWREDAAGPTPPEQAEAGQSADGRRSKAELAWTDARAARPEQR